MPFQAYANYAMGPLQVSFFQGWTPYWFVYIYAGVCFLLSCSYVDATICLGTGESYGPTAQCSQDCPIIFMHLKYVYKSKQNQVLPPYVKLPCHKVASGIPLPPLSQVSHIAWLHFWPQLIKSAEISLYYLPSIHYFCWIDLVCIYRCALKLIVSFSWSFLYLGDEHFSWSACLSQMACICHFVFFYVLPRAFSGYISCRFISSVVWRFSYYFSSSLGVWI